MTELVTTDDAESRVLRSLSDPAEPAPAGLTPSGLPPDLLDAVPGRLGTLSLLTASVFAVQIASDAFRPAGASGHTVGLVVSALGIVVSLAVAALARRQRAGSDAFVDLAVAFEVTVGVALWITEFAAPFADTTHTPGIPTVTSLLLLFPVVVPLPRRAVVLAAALITLAGPLTLTAFVAAGQPAPPVGHALLWCSAAAVASVAATAAAGVVHRAYAGVAQARERDRYVLVERIGEGAMGEVYRARHERLARDTALKVIRTALADDPDGTQRVRDRFAQEARITARLRSPHVVELYDHGTAEDGTLYYAMELLDGFDLQALVEDHGPLPPGRVVHLLLQACDALAEAHARRLVHRDIKPSNLMACRLGTTPDVLKVLDFGTAKRPLRTGDRGLTAQEAFVGTPAYAAPEARLGSVEPRTDLYGLGAVAWWLLTGTMLFDIDDPVAVLEAHATRPVPRMADVTPLSVPADLEAVVQDCLAKRPADRPRDALAVAQRLRACAVAPWTREDAERWWADAVVRPSPRPDPSSTWVG